MATSKSPKQVTTSLQMLRVVKEFYNEGDEATAHEMIQAVVKRLTSIPKPGKGGK